MAENDSVTALEAVSCLIEEALADSGGRLVVLGLCGAQGSGKSTLAAGLKQGFERSGVPTALLSIDDLYRTRAEREALARTVHPLLRTRGVPGTHDIAIGIDAIARLDRGEPALLPRFDKGADDRLPESGWQRAEAGTRLLLLEGWCVGARPQQAAALAEPINALEREEDAQGVWRHFANDALAGSYQALFGRIDRLVLLAAPSFDVVLRWRAEQEEALRRSVPGGDGVMTDAALARFVQHYERLTRHILAEMPGRADLVIELGEDRAVRGLRRGS
ncbi:kinase [Sphingobium mellinum]|uniref:kinase n=1 Tax=Sphingobium mellinum TaxID=1387166 RepID=UPI0030EEBB99